MYAVDDLSDAIDVTRNFLTPVEARTWLKLAVVVFFVGGMGFGAPSTPTGDPSGFDDSGTGEPVTGDEVPVEDLLLLAAAALLIVLVIAVIFGVVGAIMEFVLYESMRSGEVHVRRYASRNLGRALRLFGFRLLLWLAVAALIGGPAAVIALSVSSVGDVALVGVLGFVAYALLVALAFGVVGKFTAEFVAPIMLLEERGPIAAWKRFWPAMTADWKEYLVYAIVSWIASALVSIGVGFLLVFVGLALLLALGIPTFLLVSAGVPVAVVALAIVVGVLAFLLASAIVQVPVVSYFRYYALLVLGDTEPDLDLIPEQRRAARADEPGTGGRSGGGATWDEDRRSDSQWDDSGRDDGTHWNEDGGDDGTDWDDGTDSSDDDSRWNG